MFCVYLFRFECLSTLHDELKVCGWYDESLGTDREWMCEVEIFFDRAMCSREVVEAENILYLKTCEYVTDEKYLYICVNIWGQVFGDNREGQ